MNNCICPLCGWEIDRIAELEKQLATIQGIFDQETAAMDDDDEWVIMPRWALEMALQGGEKDE